MRTSGATLPHSAATTQVGCGRARARRPRAPGACRRGLAGGARARWRFDFAWFERAGGAGAADATLTVERSGARLGRARGRAAGVRHAPQPRPRRRRADADRLLRARALGLDRAAGAVTSRARTPRSCTRPPTTSSSRGSASTSTASGSAPARARAGRGPGGVAIMLPSGGGKSTLGLQALALRACACSPTTRRCSTAAAGCTRSRCASASTRPTRRACRRARPHASTAWSTTRSWRSSSRPSATASSRDPQPLAPPRLGRRTLGRPRAWSRSPGRRRSGRCCASRWSAWGSTRGWSSFSSAACATSSRRRGRGWCAPGGARQAFVRARVWRLTTGRDHEANWAALEPLLR